MAQAQDLFNILADLFDIDAATISSETSRDDIESWDSMGTIDLVAELEKAFGVKFELLEVEELQNVAIIEAFLKEKGVDLEG